jgi:hypothetical protein
MSDELTAFPLNGERLQLTRIDHSLIGLMLDKGFEIACDPNSYLHTQLKNILYGKSNSPTASLGKAIKDWYDDFGSRLSEDKEIAGFHTGEELDEKIELEELNKIIDVARDHISTEHGTVKRI